MTDYPAGTVAIATVRGVPNIRVWRTSTTYAPWVTDDMRAPVDEDVTDVRPLVVLDMGPGRIPAREGVEYLREIEGRFVRKSEEAHFFGWLADQIESQTQSPRIPEPGLWGVVQDATGNLYLRWSLTEWRAIGAQSYGIKWADIHEPALVRPGIEDGAS